MRWTLTASVQFGLTAGCLAVAIAVAPSPRADADLLVLRDGNRVETSGGWEVKGRVVVFKTADGTLASLRLSEVDLEASDRATAEAAARRAAAEEAAKKPAEKRKPVLVLTDADIARATETPAEGDGETVEEAAAESGEEPAAGESTEASASGEAAPSTPGSESAEAGKNGLVVDSWEQQGDAKGILIRGVVRNDSDQIATGVAVAVRIYDDAGGLLSRATAPLDDAVLPPGASADFRAFFPEVASFASVKFDVEGTRYEQRGEAPVEEEAPPQ